MHIAPHNVARCKKPRADDSTEVHDHSAQARKIEFPEAFVPLCGSPAVEWLVCCPTTPG